MSDHPPAPEPARFAQPLAGRGAFLPPTSTPLGPAHGLPPPDGLAGGPGLLLPGPLTADQFSAITPDPIPEPTPVWKRWWFVVALALVVVGGSGLIYANSRREAAGESARQSPDTTTVLATQPTQPPAPAQAASSTTPISATAPAQTSVFEPVTAPAPLPAGNVAVVGQAMILADGTTVRVDSVTRDAPAVQEFFPLEQPTNTLTRVAFQACAGSGGFGSTNPLYWTGQLDDGSEASVFLFSFDVISLRFAPGACVRSRFDFQVPEGRTVTRVAMRGLTFQPEARWDTASSVEPGPALEAANPVAVSAVGETVALAGDGSTTVRSVAMNAPPLQPAFGAGPGRQLVRVDAEVCAGQTETFASSFSFFGVANDGEIFASVPVSPTFAPVMLAAGQCASGLFEFAVPEQSSIRDIVYGDPAGVESARWRAG